MAGRDLSSELFGETTTPSGNDLSAELGFTKPTTAKESFTDKLKASARAALGGLITGPQDFNQGTRNAVGGSIRGAGSIGSSLARPFESADENQVRRDRVDTNMADLIGSDTNSLLYKGNKLGAEVLGTLGIGGVFGKSAQALGASPKLVSALTSSGMTLGGATAKGAIPAVTDMAIRTAAGGLGGAATALATDPNHVGTATLIGAALPGGVKAAGAAGSALGDLAAYTARNTLGGMSGVGGEAVSTAFKAGRDKATSFLDNMRGNVPFGDVVDSAKSALSNMRADRQAAYKSGMVDISQDKAIIPFTSIENAIDKLKSTGSYKGQVINKNAAGAVDEISTLVNNWKGLNPAEYHTPEGLDALKKGIGDIQQSLPYGTPARNAADSAYNAVKNEITQQAPGYAKVMKNYSEASEVLKEIEKSLSLNSKASIDTSMRKLQSLMRNNVNTNYGNRLDYAKTLESNGADILPALAGQAMSSATPRGLTGLAASGLGGLAVYASHPGLLAAAPFTSPRLLGEMSYGAGALTRGASNLSERLIPGLLSPKTIGANSQGLLSPDMYMPLIQKTAILAAGQQ